MPFVELSHVIADGMVTYPGLPAPRISTYLSRDDSMGRYAPGVTFDIGRFDMVTNTGTYLDTPFHRYADGTDVATTSLERMADLPGTVVHAPEGARGLGAEAFAGRDLAGRAVLVHTGFDRHWRTDGYGRDNPFLGEDAVAALVDAGVALVGIDSVNIDDIDDLARPAHSRLLGAGICIVEHLTNLAALPDEGFRFFAVPPRVEGLGTFPVRAFALVP